MIEVYYYDSECGENIDETHLFNSYESALDYFHIQARLLYQAESYEGIPAENIQIWLDTDSATYTDFPSDYSIDEDQSDFSRYTLMYSCTQDGRELLYCWDDHHHRWCYADSQFFIVLSPFQPILT